MLLKSFKKTIIDIEANGLLNHLIDFKTMPLRFKDIAKLYCIVLTNADNLNEQIILKLNDCTKENLKEHLRNTNEVIWHNGVKYDAPALFLFDVLDYKIYYYPDDFNNNGELFGNPVKITDTLVLSKFLQPDRIFGHSLKAWGIHLGDYKDDYRQVCIDKGYITKDSPKGSEFSEYHDEIISYCITDTKVTGSIYEALLKENNNFKIALQYHVELKSADLALRQELYGFKFNEELAKKSLNELNEILLEIKTRVDPRLPPKMLNKGEQKGYIPPATQFKQNGDFSIHFTNFINRLGIEVSEDKSHIIFENKTYELPLKDGVCLKDKIDSTIDDLDNLKAYLLDLGWDPIEWKIRDLTKDSKKKKVPPEKLEATIKRYVDNTLNGPYKKYRLEILGVPEELLENHLKNQMRAFSIVVPVSPLLRIGVEKNLCPNLEILGNQADFVEDVVKYLTYKHRRNTIAGGTEDEDGEPTTGYLSLIRADGRVSTPSDTLGASCVTADTRLITDSGYKAIVDVNIGDLVLTHTGKYKKVIDTIDNGVKPTFLVQLENGTSIKCTNNHPFWTDTGWVRCQDLVKGKAVFTNNEAEKWETDPEFPSYYFSSYGRIINKEGHELKRSYRAESRLPLYQRGYLDLLNKDNVKVCKRIGRFIYLAFNKNSDRSLEVCHLDGNSTNNNINNLYLGTSKENSEQAFSHGFTLKMRLRGTTKLTINDVTRIKHLRSLGKSQQEIADSFSISREHVRDILLGKKWKELNPISYSYTTVYNTSPVVSITPLGEDLTYDITVEEDHSYVANNIVTHNTTRTRHISIANVPRVTSLFGKPMRGMFGVEKGRIQYGYDYSAVEARVSGHFVFPYKGGPELAQSYVAEKPNDCFDKETMLLTDKGWIHSDDITDDTLIANWSNNPLHLITYTKPSNIIRRQHIGKMVRVLGDRLDIKVTLNHILIIYNRDTKTYLEIEAKDLKQYVIKNPNTFIPSCGHNTINLSNVYSYNFNDIVIENEKESGMVLQTYDYDTIVKIVTKQRISGSSSLIIEKQTDKGIIYQTTIGKAPLNVDGFKLIPTEIFVEDVYEDVWCVTVPTHYIFVKRNNSIYVSSQCHTMTKNRLGLNTRDEAKTLGYAILYGASYKKLIKMLKITDAEAKKMFDLYWEGVPALKELSTRVEGFWNSTSKKYILSIDKRKLFVRSKHSLVNLLFQSTGALIMKYGNLETAKRLDDLNLLGDPFYDTRDAKKIFQMIIYHDEAQYDVHPDLIPIHKYKTEEEATANLIISNNGVSHVGDEYWIAGENILSKTLDDSIKFACDSFKMRVPIGIEFNIGTTWAECH